jgi:methyltransferase (TIGR00027 family)
MKRSTAGAGSVAMDGVAKTAYYCCGVRAQDAAKKEPVCGDQFAELFMDEEGREVFDRFADLRMPNASNATRTRIIDDWLRDRILADPDLQVVVLGAGFDSRAFRLPGGRWTELDHPALIAIKDQKLPASRAPNPLTRVGIDFATQKLEDKLPALQGDHTVVVMEGVSMYLTDIQLKTTLSALQWAYPRHTLICDLMTKTFSERYGAEVRRRIADIGGQFAALVDNPAKAVARSGYHEIARSSMMARARELGAVPIPMFILSTFLKTLRDGYAAYVFDTRSGF